MKHVLLHSIRHTGTWFVIHLMEAAYGKEDTWITMPGAIRKRILGNQPQKTLENIIKPDNSDLKAFYQEHVLRSITTEEEEKFKLLIMHTHYENTEAGMIKAITNFKPNFPIVIPMRDPMLSLCTKIWREFNTLENYKRKKNKEQRRKFANSHIDKFKNVVNIPSDNIFLFPIDTDMSIDDKMSIYKKLYKFVDLPESKTAENMVKNWKPINQTVDCYKKDHASMYHDILRVAVDGHVGKENDGKVFEGIKQQAKSGESTLIEKFLPIEYEALKQRGPLRKKLESIGYRNLAW